MHLRGCLNRFVEPRGFPATLFAGPKGLRAFWRAALFLLVLLASFLLVAIAVSLAAHLLGISMKALPGSYTPAFFLLNELVLLVPALTATAALAYLEAAPVTAYGLTDCARLRRLLQGAAAGLIALSVLVGVLLATGHAILTPGTLPPLAEARYAMEWAATCLLIGFTEEFLFRGYILQTLSRATGFWPAALLTSLVFGALHGQNPGETPVGIFALFAVGLFLCLTIRRTGSLYWAIGFHAAWDYSENFLFGTHDSGITCYGAIMNLNPRGNIYLSGGLTGPEGSILVLAVIAFAALAFRASPGRIPV